MSEEAPAIGIDLGTTSSCVAVFQNGKVEIIANDHGFKTTPSCVVFNDRGRLIGQAAKQFMAENPAKPNSIYDAKRIIGRRFDDPTLQAAIRHFPFNITNHDGNPKIGVEYKGEAKTFFPEEISAMVLLKMKESAEAHLGKTVNKAVITVPAHFNDSQRRATRNAGRIAGFDVLRIMSEPSAAALAYAFHEKGEKDRNVLIFSLGEWSCDVSVISIIGGSCRVKSTRGTTHTGGQHFNIQLMDHFIQQLKKTQRKLISTDKKALIRLREACDAIKKLLSTALEGEEVVIEIESLLPGFNFKSDLTREKLEELNDDLFFKALQLVQQAILDSGLEDSQINQIILVGESTRIPKMRTLLQEFFFGRELHQLIDVEEVVAYGAAIQAAILNGNTSNDSLKDLQLFDVAPLAIGIGITYDITRTLIKPNTMFPVTKTYTFCISFDEQQSADLPFCEGSCIKLNDNRMLGKITFDSLPPSSEGASKIYATFTIGWDGILDVKAATNKASQVTVVYEDARLTEEVMARLVEDAERYRLDDVRQREFERAKESMVSYCQDAKLRLERGAVECDQVINLLVAGQVTNREDIERKKEEIENLLKQICPIHREPLKEVKNEDENLDVIVQPGNSSQEEPTQKRKRK